MFLKNLFLLRTLPFLVCAIVLIGCSESDGPTDPNTPTPPTPYLPLAVGNTWEYRYEILLSTIFGGSRHSGEAKLEVLSKQGDSYTLRLQKFLKDTVYESSTFDISNANGKLIRYEDRGAYCVYSSDRSECTSSLIEGWRIESGEYSTLSFSTEDTVSTDAGVFLGGLESRYRSTSSVRDREIFEYYAKDVGVVKFDVAAITSYGGFAEWFILKKYELH